MFEAVSKFLSDGWEYDSIPVTFFAGEIDSAFPVTAPVKIMSWNVLSPSSLFPHLSRYFGQSLTYSNQPCPTMFICTLRKSTFCSVFSTTFCVEREP